MMIERAPLAPGRRPFARASALALAAVVVGVLVVTELPYLYADRTAPPDRQFMGILLDVPDTAQYLSWARELGRALLIENKLTPEAGEPVYTNLFWLGVGRLATLTGLRLAEATRVARPLAGAVYLLAVYWVVGLFVEQPLRRWASFLAIALGGGLGWLLVVAKQVSGELAYPLDLYVNEPNTFLTVLAFPHQAMATGLLTLVLGLSALALERDSLGLAVAAGLLAVALGAQHGYDLVVVYAVVGIAALCLALRRGPTLRPLLLGAAVCAWSLPTVLYLLYLTRLSPIWRGVLAQYGNAGVYTPPPAHLLVLLGLPLLLTLAGRGDFGSGADERPRELVLRCWLVVGFALLYAPADFQIKMLAGWQVPVGITATRVLFDQVGPAVARLRAAPARRHEAALAAALVLAVLPVNLYLYAWRFVDLGRHDYPYYLSRDDVAALRWLEANSRPADVVLSSLTIGQYVPSQAGNRAFLAHWAQTLDFYGKRELVARFYDSATPDRERLSIAASYGVRWVFHSEEERALGGYDPARSPCLSRAFSSPGADVYRIDAERPGCGAAAESGAGLDRPVERSALTPPSAPLSRRAGEGLEVTVGAPRTATPRGGG